MNQVFAKQGWSFLTLLASGSTLFCCALPALFVMLGAGSTLAGLMGAYPFLSALSTHKLALFGFAVVMLTLGGLAQWRQRYAACPTDPALAQHCKATRRWSRVVYLGSLVLFLIGFSFAFVVPRVLAVLS